MLLHFVPTSYNNYVPSFHLINVQNKFHFVWSIIGIIVINPQYFVNAYNRVVVPIIDFLIRVVLA